MNIVKVTDSSDYVRMFEYLSDVKETDMPDLGKFIMVCKMGRVYRVTDTNGNIIGGLVMYETKDRVFVAFMHIDNNYRKSRASVQLYLQIVRYAQDKKKKAYTTMDDISQVKSFFTESGMIGDDILYEIDLGRIS